MIWSQIKYVHWAQRFMFTDSLKKETLLDKVGVEVRLVQHKNTTGHNSCRLYSTTCISERPLVNLPNPLEQHYVWLHKHVAQTRPNVTGFINIPNTCISTVPDFEMCRKFSSRRSSQEIQPVADLTRTRHWNSAPLTPDTQCHIGLRRVNPPPCQYGTCYAGQRGGVLVQ